MTTRYKFRCDDCMNATFIIDLTEKPYFLCTNCLRRYFPSFHKKYGFGIGRQHQIKKKWYQRLFT